MRYVIQVWAVRGRLSKKVLKRWNLAGTANLTRSIEIWGNHKVTYIQTDVIKGVYQDFTEWEVESIVKVS